MDPEDEASSVADSSDEEVDEEVLTQKDANIVALKQGDVEVSYAPVLPFLKVPERKASLFAPFRFPAGVVKASSSDGPRKTLGARRPPKPLPSGVKFISPKQLSALLPDPSRMSPVTLEPPAPPPPFVPPPVAPSPAFPDYDPLVLWGGPKPTAGEEGEEGDDAEGGEGGAAAAASAAPPADPALPPVVVEPFIGRFLRDHQREGVQFMFECTHGLRDYDGHGCILADDMGLGKTLQSITLLYTCLRQGITGKGPTARRALVVCPTSLVANWAKEIGKWVGFDRCDPLPVTDTAKAGALIAQFLMPSCKHQVLIISYETFRLHAPTFHARPDSCDLLICDEAHRLKNDRTLTCQALNGLACRRRVLLSGTPMQNDLDEFWAMVDFTNPGVLGDGAAFRRRFANPILAAREPWATDREKEAGEEASKELSTMVNKFILRRTNSLLSKHLPPKLMQVVCVKLSPLQRQLYEHFLSSKELSLIMSGRQSGVLACITALRKLVNHPRLIYDAIRQKAKGGGGGGTKDEAAGFEDCERFFPDNFHRDRSAQPEMSGKFALAARMLQQLRATTTDRIVIVSCYTQTLDLFSQLCREHSWPYLRLDGSITAGKRQKLVDQFNDPYQDQFVFLLSSKAGGCGLNLIGGNRLILFDPDWNPATDLQAAARVWRDGQRKKVYVYRFLAAGTLEEKVFQRQLSKKGLQTLVVEEQDEVNMLSSDDLRNLFAINNDTPSDTHDMLRCKRCLKEELGPGESDAELEEQRKAEAGEGGLVGACGSSGGSGAASSETTPEKGAPATAPASGNKALEDKGCVAAAATAPPRQRGSAVVLEDEDDEEEEEDSGGRRDPGPAATSDPDTEPEDVGGYGAALAPAPKALAGQPSPKRPRLSEAAAGMPVLARLGPPAAAGVCSSGGASAKPGGSGSTAVMGATEPEVLLSDGEGGAASRGAASSTKAPAPSASPPVVALDDEEGGCGGGAMVDDDAAFAALLQRQFDELGDLDDEDYEEGKGKPKKRRRKAAPGGADAGGGKKGSSKKGGGKAAGAPSKAAEKRAAKAAEAERRAMEEAIAASIKQSLAKPLPPVPAGTVRRQLKWPNEDDLKNWSHHCGVESVADEVLKEVGVDTVSFVFGLEVQGKDVSSFAPLPPPPGPKAAGLHTRGASSSSSGGGAGALGGARPAAGHATAPAGVAPLRPKIAPIGGFRKPGGFKPPSFGGAAGSASVSAAL